MQEVDIDKHINDDDQAQDNVDNRCNSIESDGKGWNVFKLKTWKNIFTRSNDRSEERIENEDEQKMDKSVAITNQIVKEDTKELQASSESHGDTV